MPSALRQRKPSVKRQTWPQSEIGQLETIVESPRAPQEARPSSSNSADSACELTSDGMLLDSRPEIHINGKASSQETTHTQMIWYSHHLAESYNDRERLAGKIEQLEHVCRYQSKTNKSLLADVRTWQKNYESIETELIEATQEIEEAKAYVRSVETTNANLRYALSQVREERDQARRKRRNGCFVNFWDRFQCFSRKIGTLAGGASVLKSTSPHPDKPARVVNFSGTSVSRTHLLDSRNCSRSSQLTSQLPDMRQVAQKRG